MKRLLSIMAMVLAAGSVWAESALLPASIDFNTPSLWGREVIFGLTDDGNYSSTGARWYVGGGEDSSEAYIRRHQDAATGYLQTEYGSEVHRTLQALGRGEKAGPSATSGQTLTKQGIYIDTWVSLSAYPRQNELRIFDAAKDKINCWLCVPEERDFAETNFMITAGSPKGAMNYVTDAKVAPGELFRLMIKAVAEGSNCVFEVYVNDVLVRSGDRTRFPSMLGDESAYAAKLYSMGVNGAASIEKINFAGVDPREDPKYDEDDTSMLRECAEISIPGYQSAAGLVDFPLLVRISEERISGFYYSRVKDDGSDIRFTDGNGKIVPHEVDTWNVGGESLVWVKVPYLTAGAKLTMHWSLKDGYSLPPIDSTEVWSDYIAVWHFNDITADSPLQTRDSSGHGFTAKTDAGGRLTIADSSVFGNAATINDGMLRAADYEAIIPVNGKFTFTGWYMAPNATSTGWQMFGKKVNGSVSAVQSEGWCGAVQSYTDLRYHFDGNTDAGKGTIPDMRYNWFHTALAYSDDARAEVYANGAAVANVAAKISVAATNFNVISRGGVYADEVRISKKVRSAEWIRAEYEQANLEGYVTSVPAKVKGTDNYWVEEPYVKPTSVETEEADTIVVYGGKPRFGTTILTFIDANGVESYAQPTAAGAYKAVARVKDGTRDGLRKEIPFVIYDKRAYHKLAGYDRVMLFNSDHREGAEVMLQGYYDVDSQTNKVWQHSDDEWQGTGGSIGKGSNHVYLEAETGRKLWEFRHARIGNLFRDQKKLASSMNFLPWGGTARRWDDSELPASNQRDAGTLILQNISTKSDPEDADPNDPAAAYSPFYTSGIGTIYFDAVNAHCGKRNRLKVQIATTDDEVVQAGDWKDLKLDVFAVVNGVYSEEMSTGGVTEAVLEMSKTYGSTNWFYRVRAYVDTNVAARVRIVRTDNDWDYDPDGSGLIEIDNIIVSYPAMGVSISQYGAPADPDNLVFRGQKAPFDIAFPSADDLGQFHAQVKVDYLVNNTNDVDTSFIGALTFRYRWRYLDQIVGEWTELLLQPSADDPCRFMSAETLEGRGIGDIEYNCEAVVNAPFYEYCDYTGGDWTWPDGFTERRGNVVISAEADGVYSQERRSPALGTDYFIRLREGKSDFEGFRLYVRKSSEKPEAAKVIEMKLASDNTWRGFYQTLSAAAEGLLYRIESYNEQTATGVDYQHNNVFYCGKDQTELPVNDSVSESDGWAAIPCDATTGYLMFQVEDNTRSLVIIHADYQNFNLWTDAFSPIEDPYFVGTSEELPTSGVSRVAASYSDTFTNFTATVATNILWQEHFNTPASEEGEFAIEETHIGNFQTPYGWSAQNGTWVCESFRRLGEESIALQMMGEGFGSLMFPQNRNPYPRGLELFSYRARLAQTYDIHSFNFYTGAGTTNDVYNYNSYTFATSLAMTLAGDSRYEHTYADFTGAGSISLLANYRESKGGYEFRIERTSETSVRLCLYKWTDDDKEPQLLGRGPEQPRYTIYGLDGTDEKCAVAFISCSNTVNSVRVTAGILSAGRMVQNEAFSGRAYYKVSYQDFSSTRLTSGTFGIGAKDCPAVFARPSFSPNAVAWAEDAAANINDFRYWTVTKTVVFANEKALIETEADYDAWNIYKSRIGTYEYHNPVGSVYNGFSAKIPEQKLLVEVAHHLRNDWTAVYTNIVKSFMFEEYPFTYYGSEDYDIRLRTSDETTGADIVIDDLYLRQWRGENYDDTNNPDRSKFRDVSYGAPTNFVYTTAWIAEDSAAELSPLRTNEDEPAGIRSPLMDGLNGRGVGLGSFSFAYRNADPHARLLVQIATNGVSRNILSDLTKSMDGWTTVETFTFDEMTEDELTGGVLSCYIGLHGVAGVMRVIVDPSLIGEARSEETNPGFDPTYGRVFITMATAKDNPELDNGSWWGWNLRTTDDAGKQLLDDCTKSDTRGEGLAYGLNNSIVSNVREGDDYEQHMPFLQTPIFGKGVIGEVSFKARKYEAGDYPPTVTIYGTTSQNPAASDADFEYLGEILIESDRYERYTFQAPVSRRYTAFRLAVTGVDGVTGDPGQYPASGRVRRVLIDEVAVFEALLARLGFCNVGAFRNGLDNDNPIPNMPDRAQQPLCEEAWGIQAQLYAAQLSEKIDLKRQPVVTFNWYVGETPWGYENWKNKAGANTAVLSHATGSNLIYRSSYITSPAAVVDAQSKKGQVVQYSLEVVYYMEGQSVPLTNRLTSAEWVKPYWYRGVDLNAKYKAWNGFAGYTILDTVPYGYAWINEVNIYDGTSIYNNLAVTNQYVEVAVPREADLTGWKLRFVTGGLSDNAKVYTNVVATFGTSLNNVIPTKKYSLGGASNYVFITVGNSQSCNATTKANGTIDGSWYIPSSEWKSQDQVSRNGVISGGYPIGIELIRPSGVIEHQVVTIGTNCYAGIEYYEDILSPTNFVNRLNALSGDADWIYIGDDRGERADYGASATQQFAVVTKDWDYLGKTPGRINIGEYINPDHPIANGSSIVINADIVTADIVHRTADSTNTTESLMLVVPKGSVNGTNLYYTVARWFEIDAISVTSGGVTKDYLRGEGADGQPVKFTVGRNCSNSVHVVARARVNSKLRNEYGLTEKNLYTPAVVDWLRNNKTDRGEFASDDGEIRQAMFMGLSGATNRLMTLTEMYWLDIDPTASNMFFIAGMVKPPVPVIPPTVWDKPTQAAGVETNIQVGVYMAISNGTEQVKWAPYTLRGIEPGSSSAENSSNWTSVTFKVTGYIDNGLDQFKTVPWLPLRYFTFGKNSFDANFQSLIEVNDPHGPSSPAYGQQWNDFPDAPIYYRWTIDEMPPTAIGVDHLCPTNLLKVISK